MFDDVRAVADAVLFEGYALYPYRASAPKNQMRWQFGVLAPRAWSEGGPYNDRWWQETQCLVEVGPALAAARLTGRCRFLQLRRRDGSDAAPPWDEGDMQEVDFRFALDGDQALDEQVASFLIAGGTDSRGSVVHRRWPISGVIRLNVERVPAARPLLKLRLRVENLTAWAMPGAPREEAVRASLLGSHLLLAVSDGAFVSLLDPPEWAAPAAAGCHNVGTYPVLGGAPGRRDLMLSSPVILYDHPAVAPESPRDLFDATEIDEILTLRVLTLTDDEKREARATDPRLAALIDGVEQLGPEAMSQLHGRARELHEVSPQPPARPAPVEIRVGGAIIGPGSRVRLRPGARRTDAQDMFLMGMTATVEAVLRDVEDNDCLAVTLEDDPGSEILRWQRRFLYFHPDEIEPLDPPEAASP
ncbi:MAG TPA: hypothetical protein VN903_00890 [Polyangia bacterium]|jgi:hypothetical protein|nr:hypothetical protein [Polyangia bacterium]